MIRRMRSWRARRWKTAIDAVLAGREQPRRSDASTDAWPQESTLPKGDDPGGHPLKGAPPSDARGNSSPAPDLSVELIRVLEVVTTMCGHVISFVEADREERKLAMQADRDERRAILDTLSVLVGRIGDDTSALTVPRERLLGGSMSGGPEPPVDLREADSSRVICCRFGDEWLDGFEIADRVEDADGVGFRIRRRIDGAVLPERFGADDIRPARAPADVDALDVTLTDVESRPWSAAATMPAATSDAEQ